MGKDVCPNPNCFRGWIWVDTKLGGQKQVKCPTCKGKGTVPNDK